MPILLFLYHVVIIIIIIIIIIIRLCWVFIAAQGLSLFVVSGGYSLVTAHAGSREQASVLAAYSLSCSTACRIFLDQG